MPLICTEGEYDDAARYDAEYGHFQGDFAFFQKLCRSFKRKIHILDLGCGTGRLTFALAPFAKTIYGIDHSDIMLQRAKEKELSLHAHPFQSPNTASKATSFSNIYWKQGDLCSFSLKKTFDLITLSGNTFQVLLTANDQRIALLCVKKHMRRGSIFAFNLRNPRPEDLVSHEDFRSWHRFQDHKGDTIHVHGRQTYDPQTQIMHYETLRMYPEFSHISPLDLRFTEHGELDALLRDVGFNSIVYYGDFDESAFTPKSPSILCLCKI